ncbi:hypothetical protein [Rhodococcus sp. IEGM 1408]|uniref:hypothetical protein n=1 Tax=Rhodococcus sp. IEGM 1408 TaxID=3082220 RepID=UPI002953EBFF|nr:hypothetical protein [Rhodococcus sp. IEGM 1408]MDV8001685.1 hypothetical protein [Rhodococcus sp. IEGM 1408]
MVLFWFLLALVLLAAALVLLRLDSRQRGSGRETPPAVGVGPSGEKGGTGDDDEVPPVAAPADEVDDAPGAQRQEPGTPQLAPFQQAARTSDQPQPDADRHAHGARPAAGAESGDADASDQAEVDPVVDDAATADSAVAVESAAADPAFTDPAVTDPVAVDPAVVDRAATDAAAVDPAEPTAEPSPRLLDRVRAFLPARRQTGRLPEATPEAAPTDPLAGSPVVRWLEDREFEPTPTPAPEFRHGDFAGGLSALGTVSHGMFRGRRAIMGVTGGRTVLALRRDTASDVVLDLSRPDVDAEPGFHDAGEVAALEARTSDYGRLDLIDRERLADAVRDVPADVRRVWAEGEWLAATVDGVNNPSTWDDVVMALHAAADVLAPFPPIGGRARALPAEIDPGSPGAAAGPEADPTVGMGGEVGTGAAAAGTPARTAPHREDRAQDDTEHEATEHEATEHEAPSGEDLDPGTASSEPADSSAPEPESRRAGHLRLVPDRTGVRDLSDVSVVADRGDQTHDPATGDPATDHPATDEAPGGDEQSAAEPTVEAPLPEEPDPFGEIMEPSGPVPERGDVAADHLASRPPLSRPTRGAGHAYPEDASVPPLAAGVTTGGAGIKPLGSEDDEDEIRTEVERFDAARIDGGSDLDTGSGGRHSQPAPEETPVWLRPDVTPEPPRAGSGRHRRAAEDPDEVDATDESTATDVGRERPGAEPDVETTTRIQLPPDIRD